MFPLINRRIGFFNIISKRICQVSIQNQKRFDYEDTRFRKKPPLGKGGRFLNPLDENLTFKFNAWDNVQWGPEQEQEAEEKLKQNSSVKVDKETVEKYEKEASKFWNDFYSTHENKFFKDRHWLLTEFPELSAEEAAGKTSAFRVLEVGCGVGNTVFPLLEHYSGKDCHVYCCDFSAKAIDIVKTQPDYDPARCTAFVNDITAENADIPFEENSLDVILLIFVLSAVAPEKMEAAVHNLSKYLKPGGRILFRDYGRYDMAELRFKSGRCLSEHFYVRGDGTRVYFFSQDELKTLFESAGLVEEQNIVDRRLLVNRGRHLKMYRVWIQCKYRKPSLN